MGLRQRFSFQRASEAEVCEFLRGLASNATLQERPGFFVFTEQGNEPVGGRDISSNRMGGSPAIMREIGRPAGRKRAPRMLV